ncbi:hypothetical protein [Streptomyces sp. 900105755]
MLINTSAFPVVGSQNELNDLRPRKWGDCVSCVELKQEPGGEGENPVDYVAWAKEHQRLYPTHTRFRFNTATNFQILPARVEPIPPIP